MTSSSDDSLRSLRYENKDGVLKLSVLDQLLVPQQKVYVDVHTAEEAWGVIRDMRIRGAPLIAIVACLGLAVDLRTNPETVKELAALADDDAEGALTLVRRKVDHLRTSRPTAVNLFNAATELTAAAEAAAAARKDGVAAAAAVVDAVVSYAEFALERDVSDNEAIGDHGADALLASREGGVRLATICNTGSLATAGFGTALGVARALHRRGRLDGVFALETRPYNQGSRLTAFELVEESMPGATLVCDSAAAALLRAGKVDACVVGADRVCANGDVANKIGTYSLACVAEKHGVPFYVAAPVTTLDVDTPNGDAVEIEERPAAEFLKSSGAPTNVGCWNPAFDVTPASMITGIVTEKEVLTEKEANGTFDVTAFLKKHSAKRQKTEQT